MGKIYLKYESEEINRRLDLAGTALQEHQDISNLATKDEVSQLEDRTNGKFDKMSKDVEEDLKGKQDVIEDIDAIREGASRGNTALQTVPSEYVKEDEIPKLVNDVVGGQFNTISQKLNSIGQELTSLESDVKEANDKTSELESKTNTKVTELTDRIVILEQGGAYDDTELRDMIEEKVDKVEGKQLSTEDFTSELKGKLEGLSNYDDTKLKNDLEALKGKVDDKQDHIEDLEEIRNGARLGSTALQSHQDISHLATKEEVNAANEKQDEDIAALGEARKNLSSQIADNKSRIDATATNVIKLTEELDILKGEGDGSIEDIVSKEIAKVIASAPEDLDTLREIADFIEAEATEAAQIATKLDDHAERIKKLEDKNLDIVMMTESQYEMLPEKENKLYFLYED